MEREMDASGHHEYSTVEEELGSVEDETMIDAGMRDKDGVVERDMA
jgi:hypothetical protein